VSDETTTFGEKLLGLQGLNAERAHRYRAEMEKLLAHRISRQERWCLALGGVIFGTALPGFGIAMARANWHSESPGLDESRLSVATACILTGLLLAGWLLRIAISGGYSRRFGDVTGLLIASVFGGGWGAAFLQAGWNTDDMNLRVRFLMAGGAIVVILAASLLAALLQRMHRQTQEKLLRIEYHLAELMERRTA
jgi:hypothetical protein